MRDTVAIAKCHPDRKDVSLLSGILQHTTFVMLSTLSDKSTFPFLWYFF